MQKCMQSMANDGKKKKKKLDSDGEAQESSEDPLNEMEALKRKKATIKKPNPN